MDLGIDQVTRYLQAAGVAALLLLALSVVLTAIVTMRK